MPKFHFYHVASFASALVLLGFFASEMFSPIYKKQVVEASDIRGFNGCMKLQVEMVHKAGVPFTNSHKFEAKEECDRQAQNESLKAKSKTDIANQKKALAGDDAQPIELDQSKSKPPYVVGF